MPGRQSRSERGKGMSIALGFCVAVLVFSAFVGGYLLITLIRGI